MSSTMNATSPILIDDDIRVEHNPLNGTDTFVFDPYNPQNKIISKTEIQELLACYGITAEIHKETLYQRAFVHCSYTKRPVLENQQNNIVVVDCPQDCLPLYTKSNERLEFIGDGVLECIAKYYLYRRFPKENEGFMTEKKIALVKNESIGKMAQNMGLHRWFILSKHAEQKQTRNNLKKLGCLFEAFIGALFLDFNKIEVHDEENWFRDVFVTGPGFQMVQIFVESVFEKHVDWQHLLLNDDNYKNILQVKIQKEFKVTPHYIEISDFDGDKGYHMGAYLCLGQAIHSVKSIDAMTCDDFKSYADIHEFVLRNRNVFIILGEGTHKIKKKAEQLACHNALKNMGSWV